MSPKRQRELGLRLGIPPSGGRGEGVVAATLDDLQGDGRDDECD
jgi:hypothetical protein